MHFLISNSGTSYCLKRVKYLGPRAVHQAGPLLRLGLSKNVLILTWCVLEARELCFSGSDLCGVVRRKSFYPRFLIFSFHGDVGARKQGIWFGLRCFLFDVVLFSGRLSLGTPSGYWSVLQPLKVKIVCLFFPEDFFCLWGISLWMLCVRAKWQKKIICVNDVSMIYQTRPGLFQLLLSFTWVS